ncbi:nucleoid occlusion factor SlmA [bacterium BMS3Bbin14]|nr:nucleoid occlusion factor SlmA [bacterium BMS3Abin13]GBE52669.1 nucleoid occlusion factor SlmA [bacterium BMS3Bbin14]HDK44345.1 TetR/AcrR family transcriptional regulator [Desulfobacteraceae bacterium]
MRIFRDKLTVRQEEILTAALEIVAAEGSRALTMKRVARAVGVTEAAIYRHFENKRHLLLALYGYVKELLLSELSPVLAEDRPAPERLALFVETMLDYLSKHKGINLILLAETIYHQDEELRKAMLDIFSSFRELAKTLIMAGMTSGDFRRDIDIDGFATSLAGMMQSVLTKNMLEKGAAGEFDVESAKKAIPDCILRGLLPRPLV